MPGINICSGKPQVAIRSVNSLSVVASHKLLSTVVIHKSLLAMAINKLHASNADVSTAGGAVVLIRADIRTVLVSAAVDETLAVDDVFVKPICGW